MAHKKASTQNSGQLGNVIQQVTLDHKVSDVWMHAMSDVASTLRLKDSAMRPVMFGEEEAVAASDGSLVLTVKVNGEKLEMSVPAPLWSWKGAEASRGAKTA